MSDEPRSQGCFQNRQRILEMSEHQDVAAIGRDRRGLIADTGELALQVPPNLVVNQRDRHKELEL